MKLPIYMDCHATTPVDPRVLEAMLPYFTEVFGNPASRSHAFGWRAEAAVEAGREQVAAALGASPKEIVFTSGATESNNLAIKGALEMYAERGRHVVTVATEHKSVLDTCKSLERKGAEVTLLPVSKAGFVSVDDVRAALTGRTVLVSVMHANNEIGVLQPIREIGALCHERGVLFHVDAAQSVGKVPFHVQDDHVDLASVSAHKLYGPKGIGALYVRRKGPRVRLAPLIDGGGHERGMRSGTLPVPLIVGFGAAAELAVAGREDEARRLLALRTRLYQGITKRVPEVYVNGDLEWRLPGNLNVSFAYVEGESLLMGLSEVAVSSGSACTSASLEPSYVLQALGVGDALAHTSIRFGLGRFTTEEEVDFTIDRLVAVVGRLRALSPLWEMAQDGVDLASVRWTGTH